MYGKITRLKLKKKISDKNKDRIPHPISDSQKEAIKHRNSIRIISAETRKKMSDTRKGISYRGSYKMSEKTKNLLSESKKIYTKYSFYHPEHGNFYEDRHAMQEKFPCVDFSRLINGYCKSSRRWILA